MVEIKRCLDTYALIEISKGNPKFAEYLKSIFILSDLTLAEFYGVLLREEGESVADYWTKKLEKYSLPASKEVLIEAIKFRYENRRLNLSFFDAVGYIFSLKNGCLFVTGDKEFEKFTNVEFIKK
ncbi:MAG TPA: PIN domain-containing protein [Candidatus Nanoarchaeia archaeon]|nr:PIN domain-containing protein [Candidatus Nanoarchaeia archaeon]